MTTKIRKSQEQFYFVQSALTPDPKPAHQHGEGALGPVISLAEKRRPKYRSNFLSISRHCSRGPLLSHIMQKTEETSTARPPRDCYKVRRDG